MKLLLTADLHLSAEHPERKDALEKIIAQCEREAVDYLLVAGDLFDADVDVEDIKPQVRDLFSGTAFETLVIPGNHDRTAYREEDYFGDDIEVLKRQPYTQRDLGDVNLVAVPYFEGEFTDLVDGIADAHRDDRTNVLLAHCTLAGVGGSVFGTESRYLPVSPEQLLQTSFEYVFGGHIHSSPTKQRIGDEIVFVYPGSPVSITRSETGRRGVWLLDTDDDRLTKRDLETFHYERFAIDLTPGRADEQLETLRARIGETELSSAHLIVEPSGFIERDGEAFFEELTGIVTDAGAAEYEIDRSGVKSVQSIVQTELYRKFRSKLDETDDVDGQRVEQFALEALSRHGR